MKETATKDVLIAGTITDKLRIQQFHYKQKPGIAGLFISVCLIVTDTGFLCYNDKN